MPSEVTVSHATQCKRSRYQLKTEFQFFPRCLAVAKHRAAGQEKPAGVEKT